MLNGFHRCDGAIVRLDFDGRRWRACSLCGRLVVPIPPRLPLGGDTEDPEWQEYYRELRWYEWCLRGIQGSR